MALIFWKDNDTDNQASGTSNSFWIPGEKKLLPTVASGNGRIFVHATTF